MKENSKYRAKTGLFFLVGGLAGAGLALLFAPQSGVRTRRQIKRAGEDLGDCIGDFRSDLGDNIDRLVTDSKHRVERSLHRATDLADKVKSDLAPTFEKGKRLIRRSA